MTNRRRLMLAGVGVLALGGAGTAIAATTSAGHTRATRARAGTPVRAAFAFAGPRGFGRNGFRRAGGPGVGHHVLGRLLDTAASYLGVTPAALLTDLQSGKTLAQVADATSGKSAAGLVAALVAQEKKLLAAAVSAGHLTQAQADAVSSRLVQRTTDVVNGVRGPGFGHRGPGFWHRGPGRLLDAASSYLGVTPAALAADLQSGKTLAQVADATNGRSAAGLVAALVAQEKTELDRAVSAGRLTQTQADRIVTGLQQRVTDLVNGVRPAFPGPGHDEGPGADGTPGGPPGGLGPDGPPGGWTGGNRI